MIDSQGNTSRGNDRRKNAGSRGNSCSGYIGGAVPRAEDLAGDYVTFFVAGELYGLRHECVSEIRGSASVVPVPHGTDFVRGALVGPDGVFPALDLRRRFGLDLVPDTPRTCVIVIHAGDAPVGIIVDDVAEAVRISAADIEIGDAADAGRGPVLGFSRAGDRLIRLIAVDSLAAGRDISLPADLLKAPTAPPG